MMARAGIKYVGSFRSDSQGCMLLTMRIGAKGQIGLPAEDGAKPGGPAMAGAAHASARAETVAAGDETSEAHRLQASLARGDAEVFRQMFQRYHSSMSRVAAAYIGGNKAVVEEVVQDTWMAAFQRIAAFQHRSSFRTWLFSILINRAKTTGEREKRIKPFSSLGMDGIEGEAAADVLNQQRQGDQSGFAHSREGGRDPEAALLHQELGLTLMKALAKLPQNLQALITLRDIEGVNAKEACVMLDISAENQRVLLFRARHRLREMLSREAVAPVPAGKIPQV